MLRLVVNSKHMIVKKLSLPLFYIFITAFAQAQTAEQVLGKYQKAISDLEFLSYRINNIDTFLNGNVWNTTGRCSLSALRMSRFSVFYSKRKGMTLMTKRFFMARNFIT